MKKLILKLIETNDTPKVGDLVQAQMDIDYFSDSIAKGQLLINENPWIDTDQYKVVLPYGLSYEENEFSPGLYYNTVYGEEMASFINYDKEMIRIVSEYHNGQFPSYLKKVELLPEHFNYQQIVEEGLKDGETFIIDLWHFESEGELHKAIISRFTLDLPKVTDKQESFQSLVNLIDGFTTRARFDFLELEVLASAFLYLKENPSVSIEDALNYGYNEWIR